MVAFKDYKVNVSEIVEEMCVVAQRLGDNIRLLSHKVRNAAFVQARSNADIFAGRYFRISMW